MPTTSCLENSFHWACMSQHNSQMNLPQSRQKLVAVRDDLVHFSHWIFCDTFQCPLERLLNLEQVFDMKGRREASYAGILRKEGGLSTCGAAKRESLPWLFRSSDHQSLEAVFAVDVEAVKKLGLFVGIETDCTGQLVFQLLESYRSLGFSHHTHDMMGAGGRVLYIERACSNYYMYTMR